ncbi:hypothetical protein FIV42_09165 [Persicimonas caeni]|uniref:Uncharacterized protein n=1 Tax=Persicimonas caeni TaxID=2292766 RepID=A0A4Y6PSZ9_PERCE|nr:hypothetical protein [Persicimonas caeni]QDG50895.1 hypothetical protein FIV42_09165 [Persicimonas caeni]QED32116.1 hypothetical protein FRD00_09160 [Persicimonas caeni]
MADRSHLDDLRSEGSLAARGEFGLDRAKAREKMQKFQLRDPHHYVLQFVQAAHLLGTSVIRVTIDADEMEMHLNQAPLDRQDLERLYDAPFSSRVDPKTRALRHLAIGLTAAQAMEPAVVQLDILRDAQRLRLEIGPNGEEFIEEAYEPGEHEGEVRIYLREKFRASHLVDFFRNLAGDLAEKAALRQYCAHSSRHIYLDGERISFGPMLPAAVVGRVDFETEHERGLIGMLPDDEETRVTILQNGVEVVEHRMKPDLVAYRAVIESDRLTKNLSQSAFVEDTDWKRFVEMVLPAALYASLYEYVSSLDERDWDKQRQWLQTLCDAVNRKAHNVSDKHIALRNRLYGLGSLLDALPRLAELLRSLPLWPVYDQRSADAPRKYVSLNEYLHDNKAPEEFVPYTSVYYPDKSLEVTGPALFFDGQPPALFPLLFGARFIDLSEEYEAAFTRQRNKTLWRELPWPDAPAKRNYPHQRHFEGDRMRATLALSNELQSSSKIWLVKEGHLLRQFDQSELLEPFFDYAVLPRRMVISFSGDIPVNRAFDNVQPDDEFVELVFRLVEALPEFLEPHAQRFAMDELQGFVSHLLGGKLHEYLFNAFQINAVEWLPWLRKLAFERPDSVWALLSPSPDKDWNAVLRPEEVEAQLASLGDYSQAPMFEGLWGDAITLAELAQNYRRHGEIWFCRASGDLDKVFEMANEANIDRSIVIAGKEGEFILERLFGPGLVYAIKRLVRHNLSPRRKEVAPAATESAKELVQSLVDRPVEETSVEKTPVEETPVEETPVEETPVDQTVAPPIPPPLPDETPEGRLLRRLRTQLTEVRGDVHYLLDDALLHALTLELDDTELIARTGADSVEIAPDHVVTRYAIEQRGDPVALAFLSVSVYTSINIHYEEITDSHEGEFLMRMVDHLEAHLAGRTHLK